MITNHRLVYSCSRDSGVEEVADQSRDRTHSTLVTIDQLVTKLTTAEYKKLWQAVPWLRNRSQAVGCRTLRETRSIFLQAI